MSDESACVRAPMFAYVRACVRACVCVVCVVYGVYVCVCMCVFNKCAVVTFGALK